jgi:hypothetical protein
VTQSNRTEVRYGGTRIPCQLAVTVTSLDSHPPLSEKCQIVLVNMGGCAARIGHPLAIGTAVRIEGLPTRSVTCWVVNCISLGKDEKLWLLGLALEKPRCVESSDGNPRL